MPDELEDEMKQMVQEVIGAVIQDYPIDTNTMSKALQTLVNNLLYQHEVIIQVLSMILCDDEYYATLDSMRRDATPPDHDWTPQQLRTLMTHIRSVTIPDMN